jgi:hypothetical protein
LCAALTAALVLSASLAARQRISMPFQVVSLWSDEMIEYLTGARQQACSGSNAVRCTRINPGVCDAVTYLAFGSASREAARTPLSLARQTETSHPVSFTLLVQNASYNFVTHVHRIDSPDEAAIEFMFDCGGLEGCPGGRLRAGTVRRIELHALDGAVTADLTRAARVDSAGTIVVALDAAVRKSLFAGSPPIYRTRVVAECFAVRVPPIEWKLPVHESPAADARRLGAIIARVKPAEGLQYVYQPETGPEIAFDPDWVQADTGYTYLMEQTILDRRDEWVQLPPRPFASAVWLQIPFRPRFDGDTRPGVSGVRLGPVYELSKDVKTRTTNGTGVTVFERGNLVVLAIRGRTLEIRREEPYDSPCEEPLKEEPRVKPQTYLVEAEELYDANLHLQLQPAYPKGC